MAAFFACDDIDRDNILDPKNPASERPQIITVEAFVNTTDSLLLTHPYNAHLLDALDELETIYADKISIAEHHRKINGNFDDGYIFDNNSSEFLYNTYFLGYNEGVKGVPDVFINGIKARVQGASSASSVLFRLQQVIDSLITKNTSFTIEPGISSSGNGYNLSAKVARLGSTNAENLLLKAIIINQFDNDLHERVVTHILKSQDINNIANGEIKDINLGEVQNMQNNSSAIFMISSVDELQVFQSTKVEIN